MGTVNHPTFKRIKSQFPNAKLRATQFRDQPTLVVEPGDLHAIMTFLKNDEESVYDFLSDVIGIDYLDSVADIARTVEEKMKGKP